MHSIIYTLKTGTGKDRLAVIGDIVSILGVSLATILGGAFALNTTLNVENIMGILIGSMIFLAAAMVVVVFFLAISSWFSVHLPANSLSRLLILIALWLVFGAIFVYAAYYAYAIFSSVQFLNEASQKNC